MILPLIFLMPAINNSDSGAHRRRRGGKTRHKNPNREDLGNWIWTQAPGSQRNFYLYARKTFKLSSKPDKAIIKATADSKYKLFVNGHYVGKGPVRSGHGYVYFDSYDITHLLNKGNNAIAFLAHSIGENTYSYIHKKAGILCKAEIEAGGEDITIVTDETWKVRRADDWENEGARLSKRLGFQEVYNAANAPGNWTQPGFREKGWEDAAIAGTAGSMPWGKLVERQIPQLAEEKILPKEIVGLYNSPERDKDSPMPELADIIAASELSPLKAGSVRFEESLLTPENIAYIKTPRTNRGVVLIIDFGREVFGNVEIGIANSGTGTIDLGYSEILEDGRVKPNRGQVKYADRIKLKRGRLDWQGFEPRAFRYLHLEFRKCSRTVALEYVRVNQTTYPVQYAGSFECSDDLLNKIWETGRYTAQLCMEDAFIDCPWRERAQWWADARIQSRVAFYAFDDIKLLAQGLRQIASSQRNDGMICGMYPAGEEKILPDFALIWIFSILDYYAFSGDNRLLRELFPVVKKLLRWFAKYESDNNLLANVPGWIFIDWADLDKRGESAALNCLYYQALRTAGAIANITGNSSEAELYSEKSNKIKLAINKYLYDPRRGLYAECRVDGKIVEKFSRQSNILAALFDIPDQYQKASIFRQILNGTMPEISTPYFVSYLLEALYENDRHYEALEIIRKRWGAMVEAGATTFWEHFNTENSLCHGWSSCPTRDLIAEYVGIKPVLGANRYSVSPHTAGLEWAKGSVNTKFGPLAVEWQVTRRAFQMRLIVPEGLKVDVYPTSLPNIKISHNGREINGRCLTIEGGKHQIKVTEVKMPKPVPLKEKIKPVPYVHVERLDDFVIISRKRRESSRRRRKKKQEQIAETAVLDIAGQAVALANEHIEQAAETLLIEQPAIDTISDEPKKKTRRRRRASRSRKADEIQQNVQQVEIKKDEQMEVAAEDASGSENVIGSEVQAEKPRRRRSTRRSSAKSRKKTAEQQESEVSDVQAES